VSVKQPSGVRVGRYTVGTHKDAPASANSRGVAHERYADMSDSDFTTPSFPERYDQACRYSESLGCPVQCFYLGSCMLQYFRGKSGIYMTSLADGTPWYVGSSCDVRNRLKTHIWQGKRWPEDGWVLACESRRRWDDELEHIQEYRPVLNIIGNQGGGG